MILLSSCSHNNFDKRAAEYEKEKAEFRTHYPGATDNELLYYFNLVGVIKETGFVDTQNQEHNEYLEFNLSLRRGKIFCSLPVENTDSWRIPRDLYERNIPILIQQFSLHNCELLKIEKILPTI